MSVLEKMEAVTEVLVTMQAQESSAYRNFEVNPYLCQFFQRRALVDENWRLQIAQWGFEVVDHFGFERDVVAVAVNYLDRMVFHLQNPNPQDPGFQPPTKKDLQLVAITSLYLAIKLHGVMSQQEDQQVERKSLKANAFVVLSQNQFDLKTLEDMERRILLQLQWRVNPPTSLRFVVSLLQLIPKWSSSGRTSSYSQTLCAILEKAQYLTEISVCCADLSIHFKPSVVAFAAILCSMTAPGVHPLPRKAQRAFFKNVKVVASLGPDTMQVHEACARLQELCPVSSSYRRFASPPVENIPAQPQQQLQEEPGVRDEEPVPKAPTHASTPRRRVKQARRERRKTSPVGVIDEVDDFECGSSRSSYRKRHRGPSVR